MRPSFILAIPTLFSLAVPLVAQTIQRTDGLFFGDAYGRSVASVGDIDRDGFDDFAVGADSVDATGTDSGRVYVYSGATRLLMFSLLGDSVGDFFGYSVDGAGDVNADGIPDIVVGAYGDDPPTGLDYGAVYVFSGATQALLYKFTGDAIQDRLGWSVAGAGDVNADGYDDVIGGAYTDDVLGVDSGSATVWSGKDGSVLYTFAGNGNILYMGWSVDGAGDVNRDGFADVIVGMVGDSTNGFLAGSAIVYSGFDGAQLWRFDGQASDLQGLGVAGIGDVDHDGYDDLLVGAPFADEGGIDNGAARVYSGQTGALLYTVAGINSNGLFGFPVAAAGDLNGDGYPDFLVSAVLDTAAPTPVTGVVRAFSGFDGSLLATIPGQGIADAFGWGLAGACDVDGDGFPEILAGAPFADFSFTEAGSAYVIDLDFTGTPPRKEYYGVACSGTNGNSPHVGERGRAAIGEDIQFTLRGAPALAPVVINIGLRTEVPLTSVGFPGCTLYATNDGFVVVRMADINGLMNFDVLNIPANPVFIGQQFAVQWICLDPPTPPGYIFSNAAEYTFGN